MVVAGVQRMSKERMLTRLGMAARDGMHEGVDHDGQHCSIGVDTGAIDQDRT